MLGRLHRAEVCMQRTCVSVRAYMRACTDGRAATCMWALERRRAFLSRVAACMGVLRARWGVQRCEWGALRARYHKPHWHRSLVPWGPRVLSVREKARVQVSLCLPPPPCVLPLRIPPHPAPGLGSPPPHLHGDWAHPRHTCTDAGLFAPARLACPDSRARALPRRPRATVTRPCVCVRPLPAGTDACMRRAS